MGVGVGKPTRRYAFQIWSSPPSPSFFSHSRELRRTHIAEQKCLAYVEMNRMIRESQDPTSADTAV